ncbi:MAG: pyruvate dehydrogenase complex dihydrolipoamide acetyltransferase [Chitinophagaceae bacterium]|nr:pyruvate dehydrogenase complex dihydrolipoamide acetyltransferase [Chitinophagaceae bacterium]
MAEVILMPRLSDTMTEGVIAEWHKKIGDKVKKGDLLAEVETDKATMELESYKDGTLLHIGIDKGGKLQVNDLLAIVGKDGEDISNLLKEHETGATEKKSEKKPKEETSEKKDNKSNTKNDEKQPLKKETKMNDKRDAIDLSKMEEVVLMPRLSDTMTEGVIAGWHKKVGDKVKKGDLLAEIETDKATMELESYKDGTLLHIGAAEGTKIPVNGLLAVIGEDGKVDLDKIIEASKGGTDKTETKQSSTPEKKSGTAKEEKPSSSDESANKLTVDQNGRLKASPLAKKLAAEKGIDLHQVKGSGDGGRIIKSDVDQFKPTEKESQQGASVTSAPAGEESYTDTPHSQMRSIVAKRLGESKFGAPHFYLTMELNMDNAMKARTEMNEVSPVKISFQDMMIKAVAMALRQHPAVNSSWMGDVIRTYNHIHIGSAVAVPEGLIVPVIRFADQKTLSQIAGEAKGLYEKAKNKKLQPQEFSGNTFTISNLGMMDIEEFTAIINPPDSCILAVGRIKEIVVRKGEGFGVTNVMKVTMSCDHRSVDGAVGATFLQTLKKYIENPVTMLV